MTLLLAACQITISFGGPPCESLQNGKKRTYGFRPSILQEAQRQKKSAEMDEFWKTAKRQGPAGVKCLQSMLKEEKDDRFFLFDGSALLYSLDQSAASTAVVQDAVLRSSLTEVDPAGYIRLILDLSHHGADVGPLALRYLTYPKVKTYVPMHAMKLDRLSGGVILYGSMPPTEADKFVQQALSSANHEVRDTSAMLLAFSMTEEAFKILHSPGTLQNVSPETRKQLQEFTKYAPVKSGAAPKFGREQVLKVIRRMPHTKEEYDALQPEMMKYDETLDAKRGKSDPKDLAKQMIRDMEEGEPIFSLAGYNRFEESAIQTLTEADLSEIREGRRKAIQGVSDETLYEYFAYTRIILGVINRLDLYKQFRSH